LDQVVEELATVDESARAVVHEREVEPDELISTLGLSLRCRVRLGQLEEQRLAQLSDRVLPRSQGRATATVASRAW